MSGNHLLEKMMSQKWCCVCVSNHSQDSLLLFLIFPVIYRGGLGDVLGFFFCFVWVFIWR